MSAADQSRGWHHAPVHRLDARGVYMVTCGTLPKMPVLTTPERRDDFLGLLFDLAGKHGWALQAWAVMINHYHWIGLSPEAGDGAHSLKSMVARLHEVSTKRLNREDGTPGRRIWFNFWDSHITFEKSFYARLKYVHDNPVHHGVVDCAANYRWCSRAWLERTANRAFVCQLDGFKTDLLKLSDDY